MTDKQVKQAKRQLRRYERASRHEPAKAYFRQGIAAMDGIAELMRAAEHAAATGEPLPERYRHDSRYPKGGKR